MGYVALLAGSLLALGTGASVALCLRLSRLERVLAAALVAYTQVIVTLLVSGPILHSFGRITVLAVNVVVTVLVIFVLARRFGLGDNIRSARRALRATRLPTPFSHELRYLWVWVLGAVAAVEVVYLVRRRLHPSAGHLGLAHVSPSRGRGVDTRRQSGDDPTVGARERRIP